MKKIIFILSLLLTINSAFAQRGFSQKFVQNISADEYKGGTQIWDIAVDTKGYVYFATGTSMVVYDGIRWSSYPMHEGSFLRAVSYDSNDGRLYCAGDNFFGYWKINSYGSLDYTPIYVNPDPTQGQIFWKIIIKGDIIYFHTHESVFSYSSTSKLLSEVISNSDVSYIYKVEEQVFVQKNKEIYEIKGNELLSLGIHIEDRVVAISKSGGDLLFILEQSGFFKVEDGSLVPVNKKSNEIFSKLQIFSANRFNDEQLLIGTVLGGAFLVKKDGEIIERYNEESGLLFTTVLSICNDLQNNIWIGLDGGICKLDNNPREKFFDGFNKKIGYAYASLIHDNKLFIGSNKGVFVLSESGNLEIIPGTQGQVWDILLCGEDVIACHDKGLLRITEGGYEKIHDSSWKIYKLREDERFYIVSDKLGFSLFETINGRLSFRNHIENYSGFFNNGLIDKHGYLWINGLDKCVRKLELDNNKRKFIDNRIYPMPEAQKWIGMHIIDGDVIFNSGTECFSYNLGKDSIIRNDYYSQLFQLFFSPSEAIIQVGNLFFNAGSNGIGIVERVNNKFFVKKYIFNGIKEKLLPTAFRRFQKINDSTLALGYNNGVAFYNFQKENIEDNFNLEVVKFEYTIFGKKKLLPINNSGLHNSLPKDAVNVKLHFNGLPDNYFYEYNLDGKKWETTSMKEPLDIPYLKPGKHYVTIKSDLLNIPEQTIYIEVARPFVQTIWFYLILLVATLLLSYAIYKVYIYRLTTIKNKLLKRQQELLERETMRHENEIMALELRETHKKLTNITMSGVGLNNFLNDLEKEIKELGNNSDNPLLKEKIKSVIRAINNHKNSEENWRVFEKYFNNLYDGFFDKLKAAYPSLSNNDLKLCSYIKLGLSTKEIASLLNISPFSVETARHRLRKKMNLETEVSLSDTISKILH